MLWNYRTPGIPDELFETDQEVPITKEEIRAIAISKLRLKEGLAAIDIGCGSGSITVEICLQTNSNNVYAIDFNEKAINLTKKNLSKFGVKALTMLARAEDVLPTLPKVDAIMIGGSWGNIYQILTLAIDRLVNGGRIVIDTILIETMFKALDTLRYSRLSGIDITQATLAKGRQVSTGTMMLARNTVTIISATKP
ncbi:MAG TPA: precorrin-6Y C5,15-methyltransferase (decarboxylating) subunit CbiT [Nitrososphaeraceae archaeon]|nr:precorrin-6Y C5,15-methyltransferase (decarboxylating) subunit CbiT [Nitrososphaeraceae archaeon]